jgi:hypothetical protein
MQVNLEKKTKDRDNDHSTPSPVSAPRNPARIEVAQIASEK